MVPVELATGAAQAQGSPARLAAAPRAGQHDHGRHLGASSGRPSTPGAGIAAAAAASSAGPAAAPTDGGATRASPGSTITAPPPPPGPTAPLTAIVFGYATDLESKYELGRELGRGGNGVVRAAVDRSNGTEYACKSIRKALPPGPTVSEAKRAGHVAAVRREVEVMRRLAGSLAVVRLVDVFEDDDNVYMIQEICRGGELHARIGERHYSERTVASYMRAVLRTLAQCHAQHILHRDIKPGNFMLLDESDASPLKAIDFGLAVPFDPEGLPRTDLGFEGTPWYMAPEVLSSSVTPASDVWSAGVMAAQLLTGRLPFDDHRNPFAPSISAVWRSVLCDSINYNMPWWKGVSDEAKDFVDSLLQRDPSKRPTAKDALKHPWLQGGVSERGAGARLDASVVQRIQRFAGSSAFKRGALQMIAEELLTRPAAAAALGGVEGGDSGGSAAAVDSSTAPPTAAGAPPAAAAAASLSAGAPATAAGAPNDPSDPSEGAAALKGLFNALRFDHATASVDAASAVEGLEAMGFALAPGEAEQLVRAVDGSRRGRVRGSALAASQIDWRRLQSDHLEEWIGIARRVFGEIDKDGDGVISADEVVASLRAKLPADELAATLEQVASEAGPEVAEGEPLDFEAFLNLLRVSSADSLDLYDSRLGPDSLISSPAGSVGRLQALLDASLHGAGGGGSEGSRHRLAAAACAQQAAAAAAAAGRGAGSAATAAGDGDSAGASGGYKDKAWNKPPPNFRFDFGEWKATQAQAPGNTATPAAPGTAAGGGAAPAAPAAAGLPRLLPGGDRRAHGGGLYKNLAAGLGAVKE